MSGASEAPGLATGLTRQGSERFAPINDYALIGDTRTGALVSKSGSVDWLCLPNFHDDAMLAGIVDPLRGGVLFVGPPEGGRVVRRYVDGAPVLETRHDTADGVLVVTDFMPVPEHGGALPIGPARRLVRIVTAESGSPEVRLRFAPRPGFGRKAPRLRRRGKLGWTVADGREFVQFQTDLEHDLAGEGMLEGRTRLKAGETRCASLSYTLREIGVIPPAGAAACAEERDRTVDWWRGWLGRLDYDGPFRDEVVRSAMVLRLLTFSLSGAVVAAPSSSLPEAMGGSRNWDYRFCWLRDASFILRSFMGLGYQEEARAFLRWLMHATQLTAPRLQTVYDPFGRTDLSERDAKWLEGYRGSFPVNIGNGAETQLQLDIYGAVLTATWLYVRHGGEIGRSERQRLEGLARAICEDWTQPDNGIWELRGRRVHNTYSKAMCWAGLQAAIKLANRGLLRDRDGRFQREREVIRRTTLEQGWSAEIGAFTGAFGRDWLDAAVLLFPRLGMVEADDPRMTSTYERMQEHLGRGPHMRRYRRGLGDFERPDGTFTVCGFWAAEYLAMRGDLDGARRRVRGVLEAANDLGLMSEEFDPDTGEALGNTPQGFSHTGLINAALTIREVERGAKATVT